MYTVVVHNRIDQIISTFCLIGLWHDRNRTKFRRCILSIWHLAVYAYYPLSLAIGAHTSENETESIFLGVMSIVAFVGTVRLFYFVLKKDEILNFIRKISVHTIKNFEDDQEVKQKINLFIRFASYYEVMLAVAVISVIALPIFSTENRLPFTIFFPLDWRSNKVYYWITFAFVSYELLMTVVCTFFNVIIWYLMMALVLEYKILGNEFKNVGWIDKATTETLSTKLSVKEKSDLFRRELISLIKKHRNLQK